MKICFKCKEQKPLIEFYKHSQMLDGHVNKCKTCNKLDVKKDYYRKIENPEFLVKERERSKEKYHRLNYKDSQKIWDKDKPWKKTSVYKGLSKKFKIPKGFELHHWNYNNDFLEDVFVLKIKEHRQSHTKLTLDLDLLIFKDNKGDLLDTKEKHLQYLLDNAIKF
jgi:hypothetical protein